MIIPAEPMVRVVTYRRDGFQEASLISERLRRVASSIRQTSSDKEEIKTEENGSARLYFALICERLSSICLLIRLDGTDRGVQRYET